MSKDVEIKRLKEIISKSIERLEKISEAPSLLAAQMRAKTAIEYIDAMSNKVSPDYVRCCYGIYTDNRCKKEATFGVTVYCDVHVGEEIDGDRSLQSLKPTTLPEDLITKEKALEVIKLISKWTHGGDAWDDVKEEAEFLLSQKKL